MPVSLRLRKVTAADADEAGVPVEYYDIEADGEVVGTLNFRLGDADEIRLYAGHVGYGIDPAHRGRGHASAALIALRPIARRRGFGELWITCQVENIASCRTLENAGASCEGEVDVPSDSDLYARGVRLRRYRLAT